MLNRKLWIGIAVVLVLLALVSSPEQKKAEQESAAVLVKNIEDFAKVYQIKMNTGTGDVLELLKTDDEWALPALKGFAADASKVNAFLFKVSQLTVGDKIASGKEYFEHFGLSFDDKKLGKLLTLSDKEGKALASVLLGNDRLKDGMFGKVPDGQYVRMMESEDIYLLKDKFSMEMKPVNWVKKQLPSFKDTEIQSIVMAPASADKVSLIRMKKEDALTFADLEKDKQMKKSAVDSLAKILNEYTFVDLAKADSEKVTASQTTVDEFTVASFDGLEMKMRIGVEEKESGYRWGILSFNTISASDEVIAKQKELSSTWDGWAFAVSKYAASNLFKTRLDLVEPKVDEKAEQKKAQDAAVQSASAATSEQAVNKWRASHILVAYKGASRSSQTRTKEEALKRAKELLKKLDGGSDFGELAKSDSDGPSGPKGGDLGFFGPKDMVPAFEAAVRKLKIGEYAKEPVETPFGYHLIKRTG